MILYKRLTDSMRKIGKERIKTERVEDIHCVCRKRFQDRQPKRQTQTNCCVAGVGRGQESFDGLLLRTGLIIAFSGNTAAGSREAA